MTRPTQHSALRLAAAVLATALAPLANAGPDIDEATSSRPDAGATPATARQVRGLNAVGGTSLGPPEDLLGRVDDGGPAGRIGLVRQPGAGPGTVLDKHLMPGPDKFFGPDRQEADAVLVPLRLPRNADDHDFPSFVTSTIL